MGLERTRTISCPLSHSLYKHWSVRLIVRRIFSISLLLLFMLPLVSPLFAASTADMNVPACCRRNGKHHCMMRAAIAQGFSSNGAQTKSATLQESCPYRLAVHAAINLSFYPDHTQARAFAHSIRPAAQPTRTRASLRLFLDRSHPKRGPPSLNPSHSSVPEKDSAA